MGYQQISLTQYDTIVAVTQNTVNEVLAEEYISLIPPDLALYYVGEGNSTWNLEPTTPDNAAYTFTGELDYGLDSDNPIDILQLYAGEGVTTTSSFNLAFRNVAFKSTSPAFELKQSSTDPLWVIKYMVKLRPQVVALASLPQAVQEMINQHLTGLDSDKFSIQQLFIDFEYTVPWPAQEIPGISFDEMIVFTAVFRSYLKSLPKQYGAPVLGYTVIATPALQPPLTFMPTSVDYCINTYQPPSGSSANPGLDTLTSLMMTNNNSPPSNPDLNFDFNWVDNPDLQGTMAVSQRLIIPFLTSNFIPQLAPTLKVLSQQVKTNTESSPSTITLEQGVPNAFTVHDPPLPGCVIADYNYSSTDTSQSSSVGVTETLKADYNATCSISLNGQLIRISGTITTSATDNVDYYWDAPTEMPVTTYSWYIEYQMSMDLDNNGQLDIAVAKDANGNTICDFNSPPTVAGHGNWDKFVQYVNDFGGIRGRVETEILRVLPDKLTFKGAMASNFIFVGSRMFLFKNPEFSDTSDLVCNITYLSPPE
jgi:hypothetical protein